ncbi:unnamed protein product [Acanthocheilonema viteae]|uniref:Uncharacterized protein n=1 Tax=Acanthocheilonema viteae TaxID=6277 RepID=A0A498SLJ3_ACAVI|nr:unnamed protein product [Acanthocheilonema viteae]
MVIKRLKWTSSNQSTKGTGRTGRDSTEKSLVICHFQRKVHGDRRQKLLILSVPGMPHGIPNGGSQGNGPTD